MRTGRWRSRPRATGEDGAVLVESALAFPVLFFLLFGIIELGLFFSTYLTVGNAVGAAGREAAIFGNQSGADANILQAVRSETGGIPSSRITRVVVFRASGPTDSIDNYTACKTGAGQNVGSYASPGVGSCNVYTGSQLTGTPATDFDCNTDPTPHYSQNFCPNARKTALTGTNSPPDYVGIYIVADHAFYTGLFGTTRSVGQQVIVRLEPTSIR